MNKYLPRGSGPAFRGRQEARRRQTGGQEEAGAPVLALLTMGSFLAPEHTVGGGFPCLTTGGTRTAVVFTAVPPYESPAPSQAGRTTEQLFPKCFVLVWLSVSHKSRAKRRSLPALG